MWRLLASVFSSRGGDSDDGWKPYEAATDLSDDQIRRALTQGGLSHGRDRDIAFVRQAIGGKPFAKGIDLRKSGIPAPIERLCELGLRSNAVASVEYLSILSDTGLTNPIEAAQFITSAYQRQLSEINASGRRRHAGIRRVRVVPNNMAAGPCAACLKLAQRDIPASEAPIGPLPECPHPSQCSLHVRAVLDQN